MKCMIPECVNLASGEGPITGIALCPTDRSVFVLSPEGVRLRAIAQSLLAEWQERLRCEKLNAGPAEAVATPVTAEDT